MIYSFDKIKLHNMFKDFYTLLKITISIWDSDFNQLLFYPNPMPSICAKIKSSPTGKQKCLESDINACKKAALIKKPYTFTCHAGLVDTAFPIYYNDEIIAYIMFGQLRDVENKLSTIENVKILCKKYGLDEKSIDKYYNDLPLLNHNQINAIIHLFEMCIPYFYTSEAIKFEENMLASEIDNYISQNLSSSLSLEQLTKKFMISTNELYQISHKFFGTSIKDYIIQKRIIKAKHYLATTNLPVSEISIKIGYNDYNYFIRTFKNRTGYTPLSYRKNFPLNTL